MARERTTRRVTKERTCPPVAVVQHGKRIMITWQLAGVVEEMIRIDLEGTSLVLSVKANDRRLVQTITVPAGVQISQKRFFGNTLELILEPPA